MITFLYLDQLSNPDEANEAEAKETHPDPVCDVCIGVFSPTFHNNFFISQNCKIVTNEF